MIANPELLKREDLFSLRLGKMEDSVDLFQIDGIKSTHKNRLFMRNGIFYISNGNSGKIMEFSSYGNLLGLIYNPQDNPKPVLMGEENNQGRLSNKMAVPYTFSELGDIAVARSGLLYAEDLTPEHRRSIDPKLGAVLNHIILRFNSHGQFLDYLGQEGIGGSPFPYVESIHTTVADDLVVVCRTTRQWLIYWYNANGQRKYYVSIALDKLPVPAEAGWIPDLKSVKPDPEYPQLYLHLDYYPNSSGSQSNLVTSRLYTLNLISTNYESYFSLPQETQVLSGTSRFEPAKVQSLHEFLGESIGGHFFFINRSGDNQRKLTILDRNGRVLNTRSLMIEDSQLVDLDLHLSFEGVISGFYGFEDRALVAWWRADTLLGISLQSP